MSMDGITIEQNWTATSIEIAETWAGSTVDVTVVASTISIETGLAASGPKGEKGDKGDPGTQGAPGPNAIGGYSIELNGTPTNGDVLAFNSNRWVNNPQANLTDGGNF